MTPESAVVSRPPVLPKQTTLPPLHSVLTRGTDCDTVPMHPYKMPYDLCEFSPITSSHPSGLKRIAPIQHKRWWLEPYYAQCSPLLVDAANSKVYTPTGFLCYQKHFTEVTLATLKHTVEREAWPTAAGRFLHVLRFYNVKDPVQDGPESAILIVDVVVRDHSYSERRSLLEKHFKQLGVRSLPAFDTPFLIPRFDGTETHALWAGLHLENQASLDANRLPLYQGIIEKRESSSYLFRPNVAQDTCMNWIAHPFTDLV